mmetsp:Transcript_7143/g.17411  ORF Transcript_7143/g.17411 Transcript_7143/m.17411 type:complete len:226 (-) Transcript_7143:372-1049(-)|eukprot:CAMPEP_0114519634 /NCGR_PEP_ID=MMETSP0109-20121206/19121_1 /TAXON_ID=29199 /ORGANISM="Chlorarachnion reptans, Strain CCCM449" /LENGTH=225 /DNA_ID=CAMNT_0001700413 /DNA_START=78 /DNA_END=755 /DNA_ORIENTATION=+
MSSSGISTAEGASPAPSPSPLPPASSPNTTYTSAAAAARSIPSGQDTPNLMDSKASDSSSSSGFECNICLAGAQRPVVTLCGHLYCWPCLYKWLSHSRKGECPVCKAGVTTKSVIPIYGRGRPQLDPRKSTSVPKRPQAIRLRSVTAPLPYPANNIVQPIQLRAESGFSAGFGLFPSLFGASQPVFSGGNNDARARDFVREEQQEQLSRMLLFLGSLVIVCLLMF